MENYAPKLDVFETEDAIKYLKHCFEEEFSFNLGLRRVSAPLFVTESSGLNDNLSGTERAVKFDVGETGEVAEVVHSLAKWKRFALHKYKFGMHKGLYTDMNAIRRDEICDPIHSLYVDQWDWEKVIEDSDRTVKYLKQTVHGIYWAIKNVANRITIKYPHLENYMAEDITFITAQELENEYPNLTPDEREYQAVRKHGAIFVMQIGGQLESGAKHGNRAPDYDDWDLNGDIIVYYPLIDRAVELSSMGIRVDRESLLRQLKHENAENRLIYPFHRMLTDGELPQSVGGGIGQSRLCMLLLNKAHIGEVHASVWPESEIKKYEAMNVHFL